MHLHLLSQLAGRAIDPFSDAAAGLRDRVELASVTGSFEDLWAVTLRHQRYRIASILLSASLAAKIPRTIHFQSDKVSTAARKGWLAIPPGCEQLFLRLVKMPRTVPVLSEDDFDDPWESDLDLEEDWERVDLVEQIVVAQKAAERLQAHEQVMAGAPVVGSPRDPGRSISPGDETSSDGDSDDGSATSDGSDVCSVEDTSSSRDSTAPSEVPTDSDSTPSSSDRSTQSDGTSRGGGGTHGTDSSSEADSDGGDDEDEPWSRLPTRKHIECSGTLEIVRYGVEKVAVGVFCLHYGLYRYKPALQATLLPVYTLSALLGRLATARASRYIGQWDEAACLLVMEEVRDRYAEVFAELELVKGVSTSSTLALGSQSDDEAQVAVAQVSALEALAQLTDLGAYTAARH